MPQLPSHLPSTLLSNPVMITLFVSPLWGLGIEADKFASSTGTLAGLTA